MCWNSTGIFLTIFLTFGMWGKRTFTIVKKKVLKFLTFFLTFYYSAFSSHFPYIYFSSHFLTFFLTFGMWGKRTFTTVRKKVLKFPYIFPHILLLRIFRTIFLTFTFPHIFLTFFFTFGMWGKRTFTTLIWGKFCEENVRKMCGKCEEIVRNFPHFFLTFSSHWNFIVIRKNFFWSLEVIGLRLLKPAARVVTISSLFSSVFLIQTTNPSQRFTRGSTHKALRSPSPLPPPPVHRHLTLFSFHVATLWNSLPVSVPLLVALCLFNVPVSPTYRGPSKKTTLGLLGLPY